MPLTWFEHRNIAFFMKSSLDVLRGAVHRCDSLVGAG